MILLGRKSAPLVTRFIGSDPKKQFVIVEEQIKKISKRENVSIEKATRILKENILRLEERLKKRRKTMVGRLTFSQDIAARDTKKAAIVRHDSILHNTQDILSAVERIERRAKRISERGF